MIMISEFEKIFKSKQVSKAYYRCSCYNGIHLFCDHVDVKWDGRSEDTCAICRTCAAGIKLSKSKSISAYLSKIEKKADMII